MHPVSTNIMFHIVTRLSGHNLLYVLCSTHCFFTINTCTQCESLYIFINYWFVVRLNRPQNTTNKTIFLFWIVKNMLINWPFSWFVNLEYCRITWRTLKTLFFWQNDDTQARYQVVSLCSFHYRCILHVLFCVLGPVPRQQRSVGSDNSKRSDNHIHIESESEVVA